MRRHLYAAVVLTLLFAAQMCDCFQDINTCCTYCSGSCASVACVTDAPRSSLCWQAAGFSGTLWFTMANSCWVAHTLARLSSCSVPRAKSARRTRSSKGVRSGRWTFASAFSCGCTFAPGQCFSVSTCADGLCACAWLAGWVAGLHRLNGIYGIGLPITWYCTCQNRRKIKERFNILDNPNMPNAAAVMTPMDYLASICCYPCVNCQHARELQYRGIQPGPLGQKGRIPAQQAVVAQPVVAQPR